MKDFFSTLYGKLIAVLTIIALLLGIFAEGISIYTGWQEAIIKRKEAWKAEIEMRVGSMVIDPETSKQRLCGNPETRVKYSALCKD